MFESRRGAGDGANSAWVGKTVYDANRTKVGTISVYNAQAGYFVAQKGMLFPHDLYIPADAITRSDSSNVYLNLSNDQLRDERYKAPLVAGGAAAAGATGAAAPAKAAMKPVTADGPALRASDRVDVVDRDTTTIGRETRTTPLKREDIEDIAVPLREEALTANRTREQIGNVRVHRYVVEEDQTIEAPVTHEEAFIEHVAAHNLPIGTDTFTETDVEMPLMGERLALGTETHVAEEVHIHKRLVTEQQHASGKVRREQIRVEGDAHDMLPGDTLGRERDTLGRDTLPRDRDTRGRDQDVLDRDPLPPPPKPLGPDPLL